MKEEKVYLDELPKSCAYCPCCSCDLKPEFIKIGDIMYCNLLKQKFRFKEERKKLKDCPLIDIKTHNRELVKKVCEKIYNDLKPHYGEEVSGFVIERVLSNLQKEFEK